MKGQAMYFDIYIIEVQGNRTPSSGQASRARRLRAGQFELSGIHRGAGGPASSPSLAGTYPEKASVVSQRGVQVSPEGCPDKAALIIISPVSWQQISEARRERRPDQSPAGISLDPDSGSYLLGRYVHAGRSTAHRCLKRDRLNERLKDPIGRARFCLYLGSLPPEAAG